MHLPHGAGQDRRTSLGDCKNSIAGILGDNFIYLVRLFYDLIGEIQKPVPILCRQIVFAGSDMVSRFSHHTWAIERRHRGLGDRRLTEQFKHGRGSYQRGILATRIRPQILVRTRDINRPRSDQSNQLMLIDWKLVFSITIGRKSFAKPMRECVGNAFHRFTVGSTG